MLAGILLQKQFKMKTSNLNDGSSISIADELGKYSYTLIYHTEWRRIQNHVKHLRWSFLRKLLTTFSRELFSGKALP